MAAAVGFRQRRQKIQKNVNSKITPNNFESLKYENFNDANAFYAFEIPIDDIHVSSQLVFHSFEKHPKNF